MQSNIEFEEKPVHCCILILKQIFFFFTNCARFLVCILQTNTFVRVTSYSAALHVMDLTYVRAL